MSNQKKNQNLGLSMALFATDKLLVCAPRWKQTFTGFDTVWYRGRCSLLDSQFTTQYSFAPCEQGTKPVDKKRSPSWYLLVKSQQWKQQNKV